MFSKLIILTVTMFAAILMTGGMAWSETASQKELLEYDQKQEIAWRETASQKALLEFDQKQETFWRERFEEEFRRSAIKATDEEKDAALKKYMDGVHRRAKKLKKNIDSENKKKLIAIENKPLVLTGRVVDQDGVPVPNAEIKAFVREERTIGIVFLRYQSTKRNTLVKTDASGNFSINFGRGRSISIESIEAHGYEFHVEQQTSKYFFADSGVAIRMTNGRNVAKEQTVVFKVWKNIGVPDKLLVQEAHFRVPKDGNRHLFNVFHPWIKNILRIANEKSELDGDLLFSIVESDAGDLTYLRIEAIEGGVTNQNSDGFIAPVSGYLPNYDLDVSEGDKRETLFIRSRNGKVYTRLTLRAWYDREKKKVSITLNYSTNPNGSTNLQPGGEKYQAHVFRKLDKERRHKKHK